MDKLSYIEDIMKDLSNESFVKVIYLILKRENQLDSETIELIYNELEKLWDSVIVEREKQVVEELRLKIEWIKKLEWIERINELEKLLWNNDESY